MSYYSHTSLYSAASPPISTDAWGLIRLGTSAVSASTIAGSGITGSHYISTGRHGFSFSNPERYGGGGYVVLATPEAKGPFDSTNTNRNVFYTPVWRNTTSATPPGSTAPGITGGLRVHSVSFDTPAGASGHTAGLYDFTVNGVNSVEPHIGVAAFAFKRNRDMRSTSVANYLTYSEDLTSWTLTPPDSGGGGTRIEETTEVAPPIGYGVNKAYKYTSVGAVGGNYVSQNVSGVYSAYAGITTTFSMFAKAGDGQTLQMLIGGSSNNFGYNFTLGPTSAGPLQQAGSIPSGGSLTGSVEALTNGWFRCKVTTTTPNAPQPLFRAHSVAAMSGKHVYVAGGQYEEGTEATDFIRTTTTAPVYGNQDQRKAFVPGGVGFGVTGATHHSHMPAMLSTRSVTAYGTIVIPGIKGTTSNPCAYIENGYNVLHGVSAGANSEFDVSFVKPMNTANYCVILSGEVTPPADSPDYADLDEFSILMVDRRKKDTTGFRAVSLQQYSVDNKWYRSSTWYQKGYTRKIHFLVFGGGTYGQP